MFADRLFLVEPASFGFNPEAAVSNRFARAPLPGPALPAAARLAFHRLVAALRSAGLTPEVAVDAPTPPLPDAVFPNNWVSLFPGGEMVLYPMAVASRRAERRPEHIARLQELHGTRRVVDLTPLEEVGAFLEGTGSLVLDHAARVAFACRSPRTTDRGLDAFAAATGYRIVRFDAVLDGAAVYHTNVILALGPGWAVLAEPLLGAGREALLEALGGRTIVSIDAGQVREFAGNLLVVSTPAGLRTVLSARAWAALRPDQRAIIGPTIAADLGVIETVGGGSARCMLVEVFRA